MSEYELGRSPRIIAGQRSLDALPAAMRELGGGNVAVIVADEAVVRTGYAARVAVAVATDGRRAVEHVVPPGEPTFASVDAAAAAVRSAGDCVVIGIGGGSALDTAKQAAVVGAAASGVEPYVLCANPFEGRRPIVAVPTTSGTGAEVTRTCILSDADGNKVWTWGDEMLPDIVILDPAATFTMPLAVTVATGLDAFVHAVEASSGQRRNTMSSAAAIHALRLVRTHLAAAAAVADDVAARQGMQEAALLAGTAIDNCGTGIAHSIGHALGSLYHLPHGAAVAIGLDAAIEWNVAGAPSSFSDASFAFGCAPAQIPDVLRELFADVRFGAVLSSLPEHDLDPKAIAARMVAVENQPMVDNNCRVPSEAEREMLAERTVESWRRLRSPADAVAAP